MLDVETRNPQEPATLVLRAPGIASDADARLGAGVFGLLVLLTVAVGSDRALWRVGDTNIRLELLVGVVTLGALAIYYRRRALTALGTIEWLLIAWVGLNVMSSALFAPSPADSLRSSLVLAALLAIYLSVVLLVRNRAALEWAVRFWVATGSAVALLGLADAVLFALFGSTHGISLHRTHAEGVMTVVPMVTGTIWEPNLFGAYTLATGLIAASLTLATDKYSGAGRLTLLFAVGLCFSGVILSMTRTVWMVGIVGVTALLIAGLLIRRSRRNRPGQTWLLAAVVGVALGVVVAQAMPRVSWATSDPWELSYSQLEARTTTEVRALRQSGGQAGFSGSALSGRVGELHAWDSAPTLVARQTANAAAAEVWRERPLFGWGSDAFRQVTRPEPHSPAWIPNAVLHVLFDTGLVGLLVVSAAIVITIAAAVRALANARGRWQTSEYTLLGLLVATGALALSYQMTDGTWMGFSWFLFALLVVSAHHAAGVGDSA